MKTKWQHHNSRRYFTATKILYTHSGKIPSAEKYGTPEREWFVPSIKFFCPSPLAIFKIAF
jgi:hypothetical protein